MAGHEFVGLIGAVSFLAAHFKVLRGKLAPNDFRVVTLKMLGPIALLYSLSHDPNLPVTILCVIWLAMTLVVILSRRASRSA